MFRRRTDQVYATLQQVQRRITEQSGQPAPANGEVPPLERKPIAAAVPALAPLQDALARQKPPMVGHQPEPPPLPPQLAQLPRGGIVFSIPLAVTLSVLWIASCALCFVLGQHAADRRALPGEGFGPGDAGNRTPPQASAAPSAPPAPPAIEAPPVVKPDGPWVLVLQSKQEWTAEDESVYRRTANQHNEVARAHASDGWHPWFGVRKPQNGSLQLVFGEISPGQFGLRRSDWEKFAKSLATSRYPQATWLDTSRSQ
jgi:hypothetical protein